MRKILRNGALIAAAVLLLSGCIGWMHPMYGGGPHHGRWDDEERPYGPGYRCTDEQRANNDCPYRR